VSAAEKMRAYRERAAAGRICITVEVDAVDLAERLIEAGFLRPEDYDDRDALRLGLEHVVELWTRVTDNGIVSL
jgi:hypothetical protein